MIPSLSELPLFLALLAATTWAVLHALKRTFLFFRFKPDDDAVLQFLAEDFRRPAAELLAEFGILAPDYNQIEMSGRRVTASGVQDVVLTRHQAKQVLSLYQSIFGAKFGPISAWILRQNLIIITLPTISRHAQIRALARAQTSMSLLRFGPRGAFA